MPFRARVPWLGPDTSAALNGLPSGSLSLAEHPGRSDSQDGILGRAVRFAGRSGGVVDRGDMMVTVAGLDVTVPSPAR